MVSAGDLQSALVLEVCLSGMGAFSASAVGKVLGRSRAVIDGDVPKEPRWYRSKAPQKAEGGNGVTVRNQPFGDGIRRRPRRIPGQVPGTWQAPVKVAGKEAEWVTVFGDPVLEGLMEEARAAGSDLFLKISAWDSEAVRNRVPALGRNRSAPVFTACCRNSTV